MKRIIWHWSAGAHRASALDLEHYHLMIEGDGRVIYGKHPISANANTSDGDYAAHTRGLNTESIGLAVCAMAGATQSPFNPGKYPITEAQIRQLVQETARLAKGYGIPITRQTVLSHAEVQPTLGVKQAGKWDIAWLPGRKSASDPIGVGDHLRKLVIEEMKGVTRPPVKPSDPVKPATPSQPQIPASGTAATVVGAAIFVAFAILAFIILKG